jgi:hypothetical protein
MQVAAGSASWSSQRKPVHPMLMRRFTFSRRPEAGESMVLLISYDLDGHERPSAYAAVKKRIEEGATSFRRPLYSQWLVETSSSPDQWFEHLKPVIDANDRLLIVRVQRPYAGWLDKEIWEWLSTRV